MQLFLGKSEVFSKKISMMTISHNHQNILIHFHASLYRSLLSRQRYNQEVCLTQELQHSDKAYLFLIHETLNYLSQEEQRLLNNDFLMPINKNWWMDYYAKSTYYRLRYVAVSRFLHCLHHEKMV